MITCLARRVDLERITALDGWRWRTRNEGDVSPSSMLTRHLFYTLRMIWNHTMPAHMKVGRHVKAWTFGRRHPPEYMRQAIEQIGSELFRRDDLAPWMLAELEQMARFLASEGFLAPAETGVIPC